MSLTTPEVARMNSMLRELYTAKWHTLIEARQKDNGVSWPHLVRVPSEYGDCARRLLIVGQQTNQWGDEYNDRPGTSSVHLLMAAYTGFALGRRGYYTTFWQASHALYSYINPDGPPSGFLWTNLVKVDKGGKRPAQEVEERVCQTGLLLAEIGIVEPEAVVFFTGPRYDARLRATFPGVQFARLDISVMRLEHPSLPTHTYRTYHPKYLRLAKKWTALETIAREVTAPAA